MEMIRINGREFHPILQAAQIELMQAILSNRSNQITVPKGNPKPLDPLKTYLVAAKIMRRL